MVEKIWLLTVNEVWNEDHSYIVNAFRDFGKANTAFQTLVDKSRAAYEEAFGEDAKVDANAYDSKLTFECWKEDNYCSYNVIITLELITVK